MDDELMDTLLLEHLKRLHEIIGTFPPRCRLLHFR